MYRKDKKGGNGSGVMIYMKESMHCSKTEWPSNQDLECLGVNIILCKLQYNLK